MLTEFPTALGVVPKSVLICVRGSRDQSESACTLPKMAFFCEHELQSHQINQATSDVRKFLLENPHLEKKRKLTCK
jgi:hypothetical protein